MQRSNQGHAQVLHARGFDCCCRVNVIFVFIMSKLSQKHKVYNFYEHIISIVDSDICSNLRRKVTKIQPKIDSLQSCKLSGWATVFDAL